MFITKKKHEQIVKGLRERVEKAESLKNLLEQIINKTGIPMPKTAGSVLTFTGNGSLNWAEVSLPDKFLYQVDDYFGGKVTKQEATKVVVVDEEGTATYHLTKQKPDKGRKYKLIQN